MGFLWITQLTPLELFDVGPATTQNLVVKFDGEISSGVLLENACDDFASKRSSKISSKLRRNFATNFAEPEFAPPAASRSSAAGVFHEGVRICVGLFLFGAYKRGFRGANLYMSVLVFWGPLVQVGANSDGFGAL